MLKFNPREVKEILNRDKYYSRTFKATGKNYKGMSNKIYRFKQEIKGKYDVHIDSFIDKQRDIIDIFLDIEEK